MSVDFQSRFTSEEIESRLAAVSTLQTDIETAKTHIETLQERLNNLLEDLHNHNTAENAHPDIRLNISNSIDIHNESELSHLDLREKIEIAHALAEGHIQGRSFATMEEFEAWLEIDENTENLIFGYVFLILEEDSNDYRWDGERAVPARMPRVILDDFETIMNAELQRGLHAQLETQDGILGHIYDVVIDGNKYVRQNGEWIEIEYVLPDELENYIRRSELEDKLRGINFEGYLRRDEIRPMTNLQIDEILNRVLGS